MSEMEKIRNYLKEKNRVARLNRMHNEYRAGKNIFKELGIDEV